MNQDQRMPYIRLELQDRERFQREKSEANAVATREQEVRRNSLTVQEGEDAIAQLIARMSAIDDTPICKLCLHELWLKKKSSFAEVKLGVYKCTQCFKSRGDLYQVCADHAMFSTAVFNKFMPGKNIVTFTDANKYMGCCCCHLKYVVSKTLHFVFIHDTTLTDCN
jgi:hypothetical protein